MTEHVDKMKGPDLDTYAGRLQIPVLIICRMDHVFCTLQNSFPTFLLFRVYLGCKLFFWTLTITIGPS